ncbi:LuxR C-terminal-related transcriptional regulator [Miltoncostaea oceani]|uniref:LuxR C-terminal-related transcriptional regulator n=1 Tax=Miltoncostaea oceani TaxID=2843216 RepID=UPI001C3E32FD|nr:LuxR C-terminal-related transcriptional regulator [Miltoncostaea oceani]
MRTAPPGVAGPGPTPPSVQGTVLRSKLTAPRPGRDGVPRPRLIARLDAAAGLPLTVVSAPPGFGKTALLAQWVATRDPGSTAWVSLDADDNDPTRLWAHVCAALGVEGPLPEDPPDRPTASAILVAAALNDAEGRRDRVLVLDDYHLVVNGDCHERIRFLVEHLPAPLHVVIASRRDPPLPLARMRARGDLGEVRARDLRMGREESRQLIDLNGVSLSAADVRRLHERTEGWAAGLYLAVLSLRGREDVAGFMDGFSGSNRHIVDYLTAEVLAAESPETTDFLLRTSVLDRMCGPLCDAVLETSGSTARLRELERRNLLAWALDDELRWFRYHPLLRDVLSLMLSEGHPGEASALHLRASVWWESHGDAERAVEHTLAARDARRAARLVGAHWRELAGARGAAPVIDRWLERLPRAVVLGDPGLCLTRAVLEEARGSPRRVVEYWIEAAERAPDPTADTSALPFGTDSVLLETALVRGAYDGQDVGRRLGSATRAVRLARRAGPFARALAGTHLAYAQWQAGRHGEALATARAGLAEDDARVVPLLTAVLHAICSLATAALGDDATADEEARAAFARMNAFGHGETPQATVVWLAHGTACARRGAAETAEAALRHAIRIADGPHQALDRAHALLALASVLKVRSDVGSAALAVAQARRIVAGTVDPDPLRRLAAASRVRDVPVLAEPISQGEMRILRWLESDLTLRQIGDRLFLSVNTVKSHTRLLYLKLDATSREGAVDRARELHLI